MVLGKDKEFVQLWEEMRSGSNTPYNSYCNKAIMSGRRRKASDKTIYHPQCLDESWYI
jgi:hypothetical protein